MSTRFLEERPLEIATTTHSLNFLGYISDRNNINKWENNVQFKIIDETFKMVIVGTSLVPVISLIHECSPYISKDANITSKVLHLDFHRNKLKNLIVQVYLISFMLIV